MNAFLTALATALAACASAQNHVILRYPNGKPAVTGPCRFYLNPFIFTSLMRAVPLGGGDDFGARSRKPTPSTKSEDGRPPGGALEVLSYMNLSCDGDVTLHYPDGIVRAKATFRDGVPTGAYAEYHENGNPAERCTLEAGMLKGPWTWYHRNGKPVVSGRFSPFTTAQLAAIWEGIVPGRGPQNWTKFIDSVLLPSGFTRDGFVEERPSLRNALYPVFKLLEPYINVLPANGIPDGPFRFLDEEGKSLAELHFTAGLRTGTWTVYNTTGVPRMRLDYDRGGLTHVTEGTGKRLQLDTFAIRWRERQEGESAARRRSGDESVSNENPSEKFNDAGQNGLPGVRNFVEQMPEFIGDVRAYLSDKLDYPARAKENGIEGRVVIRFVVRADGSITDAKVQQSIGGGCDEEALRVVRAMPKWKPRKQNGKPVAVWFNLPIHFRMQ